MPEQKLNTLSELFGALHACFTPPTLEAAHRGMEMTIRFAVNREGNIFGQPFVTYSSPNVSQKTRDLYRAAVIHSLRECTPLPLSNELANAIAGGPINFHVVDDRKDTPSR
ncbi:hypothetical protein [Bradyrhizobium sp. LHD-71]|uniref:hypothetical protein n=1 Tax=Bradyrhizobium sp. LHD-71 TaxID=3072141 RepID=UPI00281049E6|nr:hypothetical protein [Bradyrhizobium sp. LHD-71]MDQ8729852.1 hypothetical protein [Bradyrhizobium sp. LHD-71]